MLSCNKITNGTLMLFVKKCRQYKNYIYYNTNRCKSIDMSYIAFDSGNTDSAAPVIVMHGLFGSKENWNTLGKDINSATKPQRKVFAVDARNHGDSPHDENHTYELIAEDVIAFLKKKKMDQAALIGHSMGGRAMMLCALNYPTVVERLIIVDISPVASSPNVQTLNTYFHIMDQVKIDDNVSISTARQQADKQLSENISNVGLRQFFIRNIHQKPDGKYTWKFNLKALEKNFANNIASFPNIPGKKYDGNTLFIGGEDSDFIPVSDHDKIITIFPKAEFHYVPDAGHLVHIEQREYFVRKPVMANKPETISDSDDDVTVSINEHLLKECHSLYTNKDNGLIRIAAEFGLKMFAPRKKIVVLILGNHSAGKSTFINWYIGEHVQRTGVAIETQGFTVISSGRKRESLMGNATIHLYPHFKPLKQISGVIDFLSTEISVSKQRKFPLIMFVDTPGLVDGDTQYPFDVNASVLWLGAMADLVLVFFDPIGQALCRRTLNLVEALHEEHAEKIRFYLSKADDAGDEADRQRVLMQIVQELCKRPGLNRTGFDMPTMYIPEESRPTRCVNQIDEVCREIERTIARNVQNALNSLERDAETLAAEVRHRLEVDERARDLNSQTMFRACIFGALAILPPLILMHLAEISKSEHDLVAPIKAAIDAVPYSKRIIITLVVIVITLVSGLLFVTTVRSCGANQTFSRADRKRYTATVRHIENIVQNRQKQLYREYLEQCVGEDHDL